MQGIDSAFSQISPTVAVLPAIIFAIIVSKGSIEQRIGSFLDGARNKDVIAMCMIFILSGAFGVVTKSIGSVESTVNFMLSIFPSYAVMIGIFVISAFIGTAIGSSMGVVAAITPIALGVAGQTDISIYLCVGCVLSGAMFGDNLSLISDTTIASVQSQGADFWEKFKLNAKVALPSAIITMLFLGYSSYGSQDFVYNDFFLERIIPYLLIIFLALCRVHVFVVLTGGIISAFIIGIICCDYTVMNFAKDAYDGFTSNSEILILSLLIGGMSGIIKDQGGLDVLAKKMKKLMSDKKKNLYKNELVIAAIGAINDLCVANNTIAIILGGMIAKRISKDNNIAPERAACWLDIFSCVMQGIIPYGAQILLASSIASISPLELATNVYYCYILGAVAILYIIITSRREASNEGL